LSTDGKGRFGSLDPYLGAVHAVAEAARNVAVTGARPLAITNCLNFGNPERGEVMWQFQEAIRGLRDACVALGTPVTGGNVSFYNESGSSAIWPTPVVGMLGVIEDYRLRVPTAFPRPGLSIYLAGETSAELGGSEFADAVLGLVAGHPPAIDLQKERALIEFLRAASRDTALANAHDCSEGGLAVALVECAILGGEGFAVSLAGDLPPHVALFSESASRAVLGVDAADEDRVIDLAVDHGVPITRLGETGGPRAMVDGMFDVLVSELADVWEGAIPRLVGRPA
jgi:phosphoribosylformylglycinamidine synthase